MEVSNLALDVVLAIVDGPGVLSCIRNLTDSFSGLIHAFHTFSKSQLTKKGCKENKHGMSTTT